MAENWNDAGMRTKKSTDMLKESEFKKSTGERQVSSGKENAKIFKSIKD
jgi:hypothetical protein